MTALATVEQLSLPALVDRAVKALAGARASAEVLEAHDFATLAYDAAKRAARVGKAKQAHDSLIAQAHRTQADALEIEAGAKRRIADEYDAAQGRGEVATIGKRSQAERLVPAPPNAADIGLTRKAIHEARLIRDAEAADPGIIRRVLDAALRAGEEPTRAKVKRAVKAKSKRLVKAKSKRATRKPNGYRNQVTETQHDRDLRALLGVWESSCESAREAFLKQVIR